MRDLPLGGYVRLGRGIRYPDDSIEEALLGFLRVESVSWETLAMSATLELQDRMAQVRDESFTTPFAVGGMRLAEAASAIVHEVFGETILYHALTDPDPVLADAFYSRLRRVDALNLLATAAGAQAFFDASGDFVFAAAGALTDDAVWTVDAGATTGVMVNASEHLDRTNIYNGGVLVQAQGDATTPPITALATFSEPGSAISFRAAPSARSRSWSPTPRPRMSPRPRPSPTAC